MVFSTAMGLPNLLADGRFMTEKLAKDVEIPKPGQGAMTGPEIGPLGDVDSANVTASASNLEARDTALEGLPIEDYAEQQDISLADAWRKVRMGKLVSRSVMGRLFVYPDGDAPRPLEVALDDGLPPLPDRSGASGRDELLASHSQALVAMPNEAMGGSSEVALLLDHLSLAKEENREILRLTESSLSKVTHLTDELVKLKDAVIEAKDEQLAAARKEIDQQKLAISKLLQDKEDLEMLAKTMFEND